AGISRSGKAKSRIAGRSRFELLMDFNTSMESKTSGGDSSKNEADADPAVLDRSSVVRAA
ncbi:MAG TPA: hypothetical protein VGX68_05145, partial [Thermoanaerobaculia bacterium]|nr:hypothetical protein [Thermoanaerobaculia bacterium]